MADKSGKDATFEEGAEAALYLAALDSDDLAVISALVQDAVFPVSEVQYSRRRREFALLVNRFRWDVCAAAVQAGRGSERVRSVLLLRDVQAVQTQGVQPGGPDQVLSLLAVVFNPGPDGTGRVILTLAGGGVIALSVETLDATLKDVTRPYLAPSRHVPEHGAAEDNT
ncbi:MAG: DUF2948 family protein [Pseudorhodobacter sp.]|nr:DUF2948 family protein [Pseudorhodobacter sp.]